MKSSFPNLKIAYVIFLVGLFGCKSEISSDNTKLVKNEKPKNITIEKLYEGFKNPPKEARPIVFWWWNNNQVTATEAIRELEVMKKAGISGVTIIPIKDPLYSWGIAKLSNAEELEWQGEAWNKVVLATAKKAKELNMTVDVFPGSGWPYGGKYADTKYKQIQRIGFIRDTVVGPIKFTKTLQEVFNQKIKFYKGMKLPKNPSLEYLWLSTANTKNISEVKELSNSYTLNDTITIDVPAGKHVVIYGVKEIAHRHPSNTVKGASGPAIDHFKEGVAYEYLERNKTQMESFWGDNKLSDYVNSFFDESIELHEANWTEDLATSFKARKNYDVSPYLSFVKHPELDVNLSENFADKVQRVRYDFNEHLCHLLHTYHFGEVHRFNNDNGMMSRIQAYGNPHYFDIARGYMIPDMPETDSWLYLVDPYGESFNWRQGMTVNLYAAAGGSLRNKRMISNETMTNVMGLFQTTLATVKQSDDMNFITGITKATLHGFNYSPPDVSFPGVIRYGTFFSEYNTWWPYMRNFTDYNARLSHIFQMSTPASEIAIMGPTPDIWSKQGLYKSDFLYTPIYLHKLWETVSQLGGTFQYLHEDIIQKATINKGSFSYGPLTFKTLFVVEMESMSSKTAKALKELAEGGVKIVYVDKIPSTVPGLMNVDEGSKIVQEEIQQSIKAGAIVVDKPISEDDQILRDWMKDVLDTINLKTKVTINNPQKGLYHKRNTLDGEDILFFTNTYRKETLQKTIAYDLGDKGLWKWNPETGEKTPYALPYTVSSITIKLNPLESVLLVTGDKQEVNQEPIITDVYKTISKPWQLKFVAAGTNNTFSLKSQLFEFTEHSEEQIKNFSGVVTYSNTFVVDEPKNLFLTLGDDNDFISEITINGKTIGVNWHGAMNWDVSDVVIKGENTIKIKYTTTLWNKMRNEPQGKMYHEKYRRAIPPLKPSGLLGPVNLWNIN